MPLRLFSAAAMTRLHADAFLDHVAARATSRHAPLDAKRPAPKQNPIQRVAHAAEPAAVASAKADGRVTVQVVIDKVGHGVAPEPAPTSQALAFALLEQKEAAVQSELLAQWQRRDSIELALVGAAVLVVALVVMAIARRQQRAYERSRQHATTTTTTTTDESESAAQATSGDLESGGATGEFPDGLATPPSEDELSTPSSVEEGIV